MDRQEALELVNSWTTNKNLVKHMLAVEAEMRAIYEYLSNKRQVTSDKTLTELSADDWGLLGLIHDADYEKWPDEHPRKAVEELEKRGALDLLIHAVKAHAWKFNEMDVEPSNLLEWAIYTCDELSGFIIACALVKDKSLASVSVDTVLKKWPQKSFAAGVHRPQVELCEEKLGIKLADYIDICLKALQEISDDLGL